MKRIKPWYVRLTDEEWNALTPEQQEGVQQLHLPASIQHTLEERVAELEKRREAEVSDDKLCGVAHNILRLGCPDIRWGMIDEAVAVLRKLVDEVG